MYRALFSHFYDPPSRERLFFLNAALIILNRTVADWPHFAPPRTINAIFKTFSCDTVINRLGGEGG